MVLHLIRHGETIGTEKKLYYGNTDLPLTESGLISLEYLRKRGGYPALDGLKIYATELQRTSQTLHALYGKVDFQTLSGFREINFGIFEMTSYEMIRDDPLYQKWVTGNYENNIPPEGESVRQFEKRVLIQLRSLLEQKESALLVAHSGTISVIMEYLFPEEEKHFYEWAPKTGEGYSIFLAENLTYTSLPKLRNGH